MLDELLKDELCEVLSKLPLSKQRLVADDLQAIIKKAWYRGKKPLTLSEVLEQSGLNNTEFAQRIGVDKSMISLLLSGKRKLTHNLAQVISSEFDADIQTLMENL